MKIHDLLEKLQSIEKARGNVEVQGQWADVDVNGYSPTNAFLLDVEYHDPRCLITLGAHERDILLYRTHRQKN